MKTPIQIRQLKIKREYLSATRPERRRYEKKVRKDKGGNEFIKWLKQD